MKAGRRIIVALVPMAAITALWAGVAFHRDITVARNRLAIGSDVAKTRCGPIEYATHGSGPPLLVVHGAGGGFDQGLMLAEGLEGFRIIAPSRFGYLRTPLPEKASAEAQADAHACLLDALGVGRVAVFGVSAGGPSALHFCLRHADRCAGLVLLVPMEYPFQTSPRMSPAASWLMKCSLNSDFLFWAAMRLVPARMVETVLGTPIAAVRDATPAERRRVCAILDSILPVSPRAKGLLHEGAIAEALRPLPLETIAAPTLIVSAEDDGYRTFAGARYTAEHIRGARFIGYSRGGHMLVGHAKELNAEIGTFLETLKATMQ